MFLSEAVRKDVLAFDEMIARGASCMQAGFSLLDRRSSDECEQLMLPILNSAKKCEGLIS
jgi:hypothetical protein